MIRKLAILLVYPLYLANFGCQSQVRSPLEGLWKTQDQQDVNLQPTPYLFIR
jgi:hypothetical protein